MGGTGPPVVLAHGTGLHGRVWEPLVASLGGRFRSVAFDARGHGDSDVPSPTDFDWAGFALDVLAVVDGLGLHRPYGLGHSSGATALLLAEEARPGTFEALYCYEPVVVAADPPLGRDPDSWPASTARRRREVFASRAEAYDTYASKPPFSGVTPEALRAYVAHGFADLDDGTVRLKCRAETEALIDEMATAHRCYGLLGNVACRVTMACGDADEGTSALALRDPVRRLRRGRLEELAGLGHLGPLQDPTAVARSFQDHVVSSLP